MLMEITIDIMKALAAAMFASAMVSHPATALAAEHSHQHTQAPAAAAPASAPASSGHNHQGHGGGHNHQMHEEMAAAPGLPDGSILNLDSTWKDQSGTSVPLKSLSGRARVISMMYTSCTSACPLLIQDMKAVQAALTPAEREKVAFTGFSIDPKRDTPEKLKAFLAKHNLEKNWSFLTAPDASVNELATVLGVRYKQLDNSDYIHSNVIFLLNDKGEVIARKDGLKTPTADFIKAVKKAVAP